MRRVRLPVLLCALLCVLVAPPGCVVSGLEETAVRVPWPARAEREFGCTPVSVDVFGAGERGSGSGVLVSDRWLLTAAHVVPEGAAQALVLVDPDRPRGVVAPIEVIVQGGGEPVREGDWALLRLGGAIDHLPARQASLASGVVSLDEVLLVGFPTTPASAEEPFARDPFVLRTDAPDVRAWRTEEGPVRYLRMASAWTKLGGASGGPVVVRDGVGVPRVVGIVLGRIEHRTLFARGRAIVVHDLPAQAHLAAAGALDDLPSGVDGPRLLTADEITGEPAAASATLVLDGDGLPQRRTAEPR
ncbi:MAG: serine protease [Planctomycetota bacterium]